MRRRQGKSLAGPFPQEIVKKALARIVADPLTGCWIWGGAINKDGYGLMKMKGKAVYLHRLMYAHFKSAIPADHDIDHVCRNRKCCNPSHLLLRDYEGHRAETNGSVHQMDFRLLGGPHDGQSRRYVPGSQPASLTFKANGVTTDYAYDEETNDYVYCSRR